MSSTIPFATPMLSTPGIGAPPGIDVPQGYREQVKTAPEQDFNSQNQNNNENNTLETTKIIYDNLIYNNLTLNLNQSENNEKLDRLRRDVPFYFKIESDSENSESKSELQERENINKKNWIV